MLLPQINTPSDLKKRHVSELPELIHELKQFVLETTQEKAGHIESSLAVTELTVALHFVFNTPEDILIWDVGHQAYVHKVLAGRKERFHTNRKLGGLSGFATRTEGPFDPFGVGHSSTSISALGGFATEAKLDGLTRKHIAVIGDGALTGGMAFEALNHLSTQNLDMLLVLNDNESSIDPNVGALHEFQSYKDFFTSLGWGYSGPYDGHDITGLVNRLSLEKENSGLRVLHLKTKKKKYRHWLDEFSLRQAQGDHSFNDEPPKESKYQDIFTDQLIALAKENEDIVAITPAMLSGSSLLRFNRLFPERCFDTGITEQHAVTFAAGLAAAGKRPVVHLYSTFAQRAYDQIIHDVALQNLPVVFAIDRAGLVGEDGATHHGAFGLSMLNTIPNMQILAPMNAAELKGMMIYATHQEGPVAIRFPRGGELVQDETIHPIKMGSFRELKKGSKTVVVSLGTIGKEVQEAIIDKPDIGHIDLRFLKPWNDTELANALDHYENIITVENGSMRGGLRDTMASWVSENLSGKRVLGLGLPDRFIGHGTPEELADEVGLSIAKIKSFISAL